MIIIAVFIGAFPDPAGPIVVCRMIILVVVWEEVAQQQLRNANNYLNINKTKTPRLNRGVLVLKLVLEDFNASSFYSEIFC